MSRRWILAALSLSIAAGLAAAAEAGPRLYRGENVWYAVSGGVITYSVFVADAADGTRSYGADAGSEAIYTRIRATTPATFKRLGVSVQEATGCAEAADRNGRGVSGWAFSCAFPLAAPAAPAGDPASTRVATAPTAPAAPPPAAAVQKVSAPAAAPKPAAPPAAAPTVVATATTTPPGPPPAPRPVAPAEASSNDADLNARMKADLEAVDARNAARAAEFEAAKKATADTYAAQLAAYQAQVKETERKRQADLDAWKARVAACKGGDVSQCGQ